MNFINIFLKIVLNPIIFLFYESLRNKKTFYKEGMENKILTGHTYGNNNKEKHCVIYLK